ncbi:IS200/IS605 family transposase [Taibaiella lutea]|uniref:IS200/IS605 family transposase n=1 Tax=Taibaiella lutea TaxID=2608001 RepID=A0A5M6CDN0_9BACT|nr:IS200/IS605 family transposase [Taibaiella lutea]KAA5532560.1 IS200/IS605 family transposase [Taibaiella lutea]
MQHYRKGAHTVYDLKYHIVWITKYRKPVLTGEVAIRVRELVREICKANDIEIIKGHVSKDHVHLFISAPPHLSISKIVQFLKGKSSRKILSSFVEMQKQFWGRHFWARGYFVASSGNITDEVIMKYIEEQELEDEDQNFKIGQQ